jgi:hypothetical protein
MRKFNRFLPFPIVPGNPVIVPGSRVPGRLPKWVGNDKTQSQRGLYRYRPISFPTLLGNLKTPVNTGVPGFPGFPSLKRESQSVMTDTLRDIERKQARGVARNCREAIDALNGQSQNEARNQWTTLD